MTDTNNSDGEPTKPHPSKPKILPSDAWISFIKGIRSSIIEAFWSGVQIKETGDCNTDYGEHFSTLNLSGYISSLGTCEQQMFVPLLLLRLQKRAI